MRATDIHLNGCYRLKASVLRDCVQADGKPIDCADVTIVRIQFPAGRKRAWYYDRQGNAYRAEDFERRAEVIDVDIF